MKVVEVNTDEVAAVIRSELNDLRWRNRDRRWDDHIFFATMGVWKL